MSYQSDVIYADKIQNECQIVLVGLETRDDVMNTLSINAELVTDSDTDVERLKRILNGVHGTLEVYRCMF